MTPALQRLIRSVAQVLAQSSDLPSPCQSICVMDEHSLLCKGCLRNIDEIASWGQLSDAQKRQIWTQISVRATQI
jgi:predicted Fe-S protein YdhL (DUF1289 family)